jgi:DNA modification methylase
VIVNANALHIPLADKCVHTIVTSPPYYGLRDYGVGGQIGLDLSLTYLRENAQVRIDAARLPMLEMMEVL